MDWFNYYGLAIMAVIKDTVDGEELDVNEELYYSNLNPSDYDSCFQGLIDEYKKTLQESDNSTTKG